MGAAAWQPGAGGARVTAFSSRETFPSSLILAIVSLNQLSCPGADEHCADTQRKGSSVGVKVQIANKHGKRWFMHNSRPDLPSHAASPPSARVETSDGILAAENRHSARHRGIHTRERVSRFYHVGILVRGDGVRRMRERMRATEVRGRPNPAEAELSDQKRW